MTGVAVAVLQWWQVLQWQCCSLHRCCSSCVAVLITVAAFVLLCCRTVIAPQFHCVNHVWMHASYVHIHVCVCVCNFIECVSCLNARFVCTCIARFIYTCILSLVHRDQKSIHIWTYYMRICIQVKAQCPENLLGGAFRLQCKTHVCMRAHVEVDNHWVTCVLCVLCVVGLFSAIRGPYAHDMSALYIFRNYCA